MSVGCFHLMLLVIYCLWILIFISMEQIQTENNKSITARCHVSLRTFGAFIGESIHSSTRYSLFCETDKCKDELHAHMGLEGIQRASYRLCACVCVCLFIWVCASGGQIGRGGRGGRLFIFHSWHISLGGPRRCNKKPCISVTWCAECNCSPDGSKWKQRSSISQHAGLKQDHKNPPLPFARNVPALPQCAHFTRSSSSWQGNSGCVCLCVCACVHRQGLRGSLLIYLCLIMLHCGVTSQLFALSRL